MPIFQKLFGNADDKAKAAVTPPGLQTMGAPLQRKFAKGVQYNSKIDLFMTIYNIIYTGQLCLGPCYDNSFPGILSYI